MGLGLGLGLGLDFSASFVAAILVLKVVMGLGFVTVGAAKELVVVVLWRLGRRRTWLLGCGWLLGYLVATMGAMAVGRIGFCHGCGWVLGEFGKNKNK